MDTVNADADCNKLLLTHSTITESGVPTVSPLEERCKEVEERVKTLEEEVRQEKIRRAEAEKKLLELERRLSEWIGDAVMQRLSSLDNKLNTVLKVQAPLQAPPRVPPQIPPQIPLQTPPPASRVSALQAAVLRHDENLWHGLEVKDDKVNLGLNVFCTLSSWLTLNRVSQMTDWITSILKGVFGEEAKLYRKQPRNNSLRAFPSSFLDVAKIHFKTFLDRRIKELEKEEDEFSKSTLDFFRKNYEILLQQLPASLSDKAFDMARCEQRAARRKANPASEQFRPKLQRTTNIMPRKKAKKMLTQPRQRHLSS